MADIFKRNLLKKVGDISQLAGVREFEYLSGKAKNTRGLEIYNNAGLYFTVLPDKGMDIIALNYKGINFGFLSKNNITGNKYFNALGNEFLYYWSAGLLATCGLANTGESNTDGGLYMTEHGRIGSMPAENLSIRNEWVGEDYIIEVSGKIRESYIYGSNLQLNRTIKTGLLSKQITITDTIENMEPSDEELMLLYHINFGYPLVDEGAEILTSKSDVIPKTEMSDSDISEWMNVHAPVDDCPEKVFYHVNQNSSTSYAAVLNTKLGCGCYIKYDSEILPVLVQWKSMRSHDYTVGLEPSNSYILGRNEERKNGSLKIIKGYDKVTHRIEIGIIDGVNELESFRKLIN